jgi:purine-binding chemotaxis protein CheW
MKERAENQYLTFSIDGEMYAIQVGKVQEVLEYIKPVRLPRTVEYFKGLINVRGTGIPVVDLRLRFGMPSAEITRDSAIIVLEIKQEGGTLILGALTDAVHEVVELNEEQLEQAPKFGSKIDVDFIKNIGNKNDKFIIILNVDYIFNSDNVIEIEDCLSEVG